MIRHIVLFKLKPGYSWDDDEVRAAERTAREVGDQVEDLVEWRAGRNVSDRDIAYDFAVIGLVHDQDALRRYLDHPFHRDSVRRWRVISDWVVVDLEEPAPVR
ncbi:Dabb family protein [Actinosynnema sp. NPDC023794]